MSKNDFKQFLTEQRTAAAVAYVNGDAALLAAIVAADGSATFHSPSGDTVSSAASVAARYSKDAASFAPGSTSHFEILQMQENDNLAFWSGFQVAKVHLAGKDDAVDMRIRVTEVFHRVGNAWEMIHRHADMPPSKPAS